MKLRPDPRIECSMSSVFLIIIAIAVVMVQAEGALLHKSVVFTAVQCDKCVTRSVEMLFFRERSMFAIRRAPLG